MRKSYAVLLLVTVGVLAVLTAVAFSSPAVSFRSAEGEGARAAEVLIGEQPVIVLRTAAGGLSPLERAEIIAGRLRAALAGGAGPDDLAVTVTRSGASLSIADRVITTASPSEAEAQEATPAALATQWMDNLLVALEYDGSETETAPADEGEAAETETGSSAAAALASEVSPAPPAVDWTGTAQKWVPILSVDQDGAQIGAAQVAGPPSQVNQVKGVAELRLSFKGIGRIYAYVPVRTLTVTKLDRVQGVSVWATGELQLVNF